MKTIATYIITIFCFAQIAYSQNEDGVVAFDIPARNSLTFNRFLINPTFSFVREQNKYITASNKRELVQIEDAPLTYFFNYSGRLKENIGAGLGFYQQNYGVLTTFGGVLNFAYNVRLQEDSNLTFGTNIGAYKSGLNSDKVVTNFDDPSLDNIPSNFLLTVNPGLNYGTGFMDFGVTLNNFVTYNFNTSELLDENPKKGIQGHIMYTGYFGGYGFFGESKFSALARTEFQEDNSIYSGTIMLTVPKGVWAQVGYNNVYGASGGIGINLTPQIAIEYNYEKPLTGFSNLGPAHEFTLAYRFKNNNYYDYSRDDELAGLFSPETKKRKKKSRKKTVAAAPKAPVAETNITPEPIEPAVAAAPEMDVMTQDDIDTEEQARLASEAQAKRDAEEQARLAAEAQAKRDAEEQARLAAEAQAKRDAEEQARLASEAQAKRDAEEQARLAAEAQAKRDTEEQARLAAEAQAKRDAEEQARLAAEAQAKRDAEEQARLAAEAQAKRDAEEQARLAAEAQAKIDAEEQARLAAEAQARLAAEAQAKRDAEEQARLAAEAQAERDAEEQARLVAEAQAKKDAEEQARLAAEARAELDVEEEPENLIEKPTDNIGKTISTLADQTEESGQEQDKLLAKLETALAIKDKDLKDLKEENDLSDRNIYVAPKPFKSVTAENKAIEELKISLDTVIIRRKKKIAQLESLIQDRIKTINDPKDETNLYYLNMVSKLEAEQLAAIRARESIVSSLKQVAVATDFERKRRIKRASYDNDQDRYIQDRAKLSSLKQYASTNNGSTLSKDDLDFGKERSTNIQIIKNVPNSESGYYLVLAVHSDVNKRNKFLSQVISTGNTDIDFFYDVNTSEYYIYSKKFETIKQANREIDKQDNKAYNEKMTIIKIEN